MVKSYFQVVLICFVGLFLFQSCIYSGDSVLEQRRKDQLGKYVIDMERTEWGEYEAEKEIYKDLTIVFKKDMTFEVSRSVLFFVRYNRSVCNQRQWKVVRYPLSKFNRKIW